MSEAVERPPDTSEANWLACLLAVERRENRALRKYNAWLTRRIEELERKLPEEKVLG